MKRILCDSDHKRQLLKQALFETLLYICLHQNHHLDEEYLEAILFIYKIQRSDYGDCHVTKKQWFIDDEDAHKVLLSAFWEFTNDEQYREIRGEVAKHFATYDELKLENIAKKIAARKILRYLHGRFGNAQGLHEYIWRPGGPIMNTTFQNLI